MVMKQDRRLAWDSTSRLCVTVDVQPFIILNVWLCLTHRRGCAHRRDDGSRKDLRGDRSVGGRAGIKIL